MSRPYEDVTTADVGASVIAWIAAMRAMRHRTARGGLTYFKVEEGTADALVRDFVAMATGWADTHVPGARERMDALGMAVLSDSVANSDKAAS